MTTPQLKLFNALTREKEIFKPLDPSNVRMYVCGITPYDHAHIGNLRTILTFDILYRLLSHLYPKVTSVRNYTDIDDKIVERAQETGKQPFDLAAEFIEIFERDTARMNILDLPRAQKPRVSDYMREIATMVDNLIEKGFAYVTASGDVMYSVPAFEALPNPPHQKFGYLARRTFDKLQARVEEDAEKHDPRDFPIWKANAKSATKLEQAFNPQDLGAKLFSAPGRPGWHIECSVMSEALLGKNYKPGDTALFDIHGGGEDLPFPHHSCEIAQTEALHPTCTMSSVWMHAAFLTVDGAKMSKSLGNFLTIEDALAKYSPQAIRLWLLQTHYRKPVDYSDEALQAADNAVRRIRNAFEKFSQFQLPDIKEYRMGTDKEVVEKIVNDLSNDLSTAEALSHIFVTLDAFEISLNMAAKGDLELLESSVEAQRILKLNLQLIGLESLSVVEGLDKASESLLQKRATARAAKNFAESDRLREELKSMGILVEDGPTGQTWRRL